MDHVRGHDRLWSIVLAGGEGERVRPLVHRWLGQHRPKQYCTFVGTRSMFQHTVDRAASLMNRERIVTVIAPGHRKEALAQLGGRGIGTVLLQPDNRDTAAGVFLPLTYIRARNSHATVVIYPSDHFVYPEDRFLEAVQQAIVTAEALPDQLILLGVSPDRLELEYGWILLGRKLSGFAGYDVQAVHRFLEKPSAADADAAVSAGALWNTLVLASKVEALWSLGWRCLPEMMPLFERLGQAIGTSAESHVLEDIYRAMPAKNFSSDLLQLVPTQMAVIELTGVLWSDWGKPERIADCLRRIERQPTFPLSCLAKPFAPLDTAGACGGPTASC